MPFGQLGLSASQDLGLPAEAGRGDEPAPPPELGIGQVGRSRRLHLSHRGVGRERLHHHTERGACRSEDQGGQEVAPHFDPGPLGHPERGVGHAVHLDVRPALVHGHGPRVGNGRAAFPRRSAGCIGSQQPAGEFVGTQQRLHVDVGVGEEAQQRLRLACEGGAAALHRAAKTNLHREVHVVGRGPRLHVCEQPLVGRRAGRRRIPHGLGSEIRPGGITIVGEGRRQPLHPVYRRSLAGQCGQYGGPGGHTAILLVGPEQREAPTLQRQYGRQRVRGAVVDHSHVAPSGLQDGDVAQGGHAGPARPWTTNPAGAPVDHDGQPFVPRAAGHRDGGQRAVHNEDDEGHHHPYRVGRPAQHQDPEDQAHGNREDLTRPPPGQRPASLPRTEAVTGSSSLAHDSPPVALPA